MLLEKAYVKYDKNREYDYTISSEFIKFASENEAKEYIENHIENNVEYYFYQKEGELHYNVVICNNQQRGE